MATLKKMQEQVENTFKLVVGLVHMYYGMAINPEYPTHPYNLLTLNMYTVIVKPNGETHCNTADHKVVFSGLQLDQLATEIYDRLVTRDHKYKPERLRDACETAAITFACMHEVVHVVMPNTFDEHRINAATLHLLSLSDLLGGYPEDAEMLEVLEEIALGVKHH